IRERSLGRKSRRLSYSRQRERSAYIDRLRRELHESKIALVVGGSCEGEIGIGIRKLVESHRNVFVWLKALAGDRNNCARRIIGSVGRHARGRACDEGG